MQAFAGEQLEEIGASNLAELIDFIPGASEGRGNAAGIQSYQILRRVFLLRLQHDRLLSRRSCLCDSEPQLRARVAHLRCRPSRSPTRPARHAFFWPGIDGLHDPLHHR